MKGKEDAVMMAGQEPKEAIQLDQEGRATPEDESDRMYFSRETESDRYIEIWVN